MPTMRNPDPRQPVNRGFFSVVILLLAMLTAGCGSYSTPKVQATATATPAFCPTATPAPAPASTLTPVALPWDVTIDQVTNTLRINYAQRDGSVPQYGALDLKSGYLRLLPSPTAGWGSSIILLPSFWCKTSSAASQYYQGAPVRAQAATSGQQLVLTLTGKSGGLSVTTILQLDPPVANPPQIHAHVMTTTTGRIALDTTRTDEIFKPVMLSSMRISSTKWDVSAATAEGKTYPIPSSGWIMDPGHGVTGATFGLVGGSSHWKANAPTITITLATHLTITGIVKKDLDPNDENVGYWAASDHVLSTWSYDIAVTPAG